MSDSEEENQCYYFGTPLEPYDEDAFPKKRPITVEEQIAKDAQGRRRFHGAFTGGFSAGFFNTVGSLEGWKPTDFRSSRTEKAINVSQKPTDFMDDEDIGEFGIAPQVIQATREYAHSNKRKKDVFASGPIPGQPVLQTLIESGNETVGYYILKNMTVKQKKQIKQEIDENKSNKVYGCEMPKSIENIGEILRELYVLPEIYNQYLHISKSNTAGLGHSGLDRNVDISQSHASLTMRDKNNKRISISSQAFGVGAFEEEDEDIYTKEDMSKYDFELTKEKRQTTNVNEYLGHFQRSNAPPLVFKDNFPPPIIPSSFTGIHNVKKSRFEPLHLESKKNQQNLSKRKDIDASVRAKYLGEDDVAVVEHSNTSTSNSNQNLTSSDDNIKKEDDNKDSAMPNFLVDRFVSASQVKVDDNEEGKNSEKSIDMTHGSKEMYDAVRMKLFGPLTRKSFTWQPSSFLCKRFNVPEPKSRDEDSQKHKKRTKALIFEYQKHIEEEPSTSGISTSIKLSATQQVTVIEEKTVTQEVEVVKDDSVEIKTEDEEISTNLNYDDKIDVCEKGDLFKAIFLSSSSESEDEDDKVEQENRMKEIKENVLNDSMLPKIKPTKEGILSNLDFSSINKNQINNNTKNNNDATEKKSAEQSTSNVNEATLQDDNMYGPKLPEKTNSQFPAKTNQISIDLDSDEWVERKSEKEKKRKHKKKRKKEKHKEKRERKNKV